MPTFSANVWEYIYIYIYMCRSAGVGPILVAMARVNPYSQHELMELKKGNGKNQMIDFIFYIFPSLTPPSLSWETHRNRKQKVWPIQSVWQSFLERQIIPLPLQGPHTCTQLTLVVGSLLFIEFKYKAN